MGELKVRSTTDSRNRFVHHLINDVKALDHMLAEQYFEKGIQRVGAEQELCLVDAFFQPTMIGPELLEAGLPPQFTTEIGRFNLEINLDPQVLDASALDNTLHQLEDMLSLLKKRCHDYQSKVLLTGILPTLRKSHLGFENMTPRERYFLLSHTMHKMRGNDFEIHVLGTDELIARLDNILFEACNTSFQLHLQIDPHDFVAQYNWAQWISGPVLAISANSPVLMGRELWHETRIALFQQSVDLRTSSNHNRQKSGRVSFGHRWLNQSVSEYFKENISRYPLILASDIEEDSLDCLYRNSVPDLKALKVHNGTIYSWNRPCYGISDTGYPHLRIECRYIPAGPTVADEMANFAFWLGLMKGMPEKYSTLCEDVPFRQASEHFYHAARNGLQAQFWWNGHYLSAQKLVLDRLLPIAAKGLSTTGMNHHQIQHYLNIIERRAISGQNGANWQIRNFRKLLDCYGVGVAVQELTAGLVEGFHSGRPVHEWDDISCTRLYDLGNSPWVTIGRVMHTDVFTLSENDSVAMVKAMMQWKNIRHVPIENEAGELIGLVTASNLTDILADDDELLAKDVMTKELITVEEGILLDEAFRILKLHGIGCLPVLTEGKMVGFLTDTDFREWYG
ncbi:MAG TPA: CBS domain-containing protein [Saprospiraceae bacterium]|nr:CBS domain-containing protein [Saprospiraceae bacterium]HMQ84119.1 CBS domain-containing protein [Saprospiraceae bacterium]